MDAHGASMPGVLSWFDLATLEYLDLRHNALTRVRAQTHRRMLTPLADFSMAACHHVSLATLP